MELKRVLANDIRTAKEQAWARFGKDVLILSNERVNGRVELIVATDMTGVGSGDRTEDIPAGRSAGSTAADGASFGKHFSRALSAIDGTSNDERTTPAAQMLAVRERQSTADSMRAEDLVEMIRGELDQMRREFRIASSHSAWNRPAETPEELNELANAMQDANIPFTLRALLLDEIKSCRTAIDARERIRSILGASVNKVPAGAPSTGVHVIAGPSGAGKSHMVGRLAGMQSATLTAEDVAIISYKDQRTGAWPQIQLIGSGNGVDVYRARSEEMLTELIANLSTKSLLIVDTPGHKCMEHVTSIQAHVPSASFHLAVPADASLATLRTLIDESKVKWQSLMITKSDECVNAWPLLEFLCKRKAAISFVGDVAINGEDDVLARVIGNLAEISVRQLKTSQAPVAPAGLNTGTRNYVSRTN